MSAGPSDAGLLDLDEEGSDAVLIEWTDELADRVRAGLPVDWEGLARRDPARAERLRRMLSAVELTAVLGASDIRERPRSGQRPRNPGQGLHDHVAIACRSPAQPGPA